MTIGQKRKKKSINEVKKKIKTIQDIDEDDDSDDDEFEIKDFDEDDDEEDEDDDDLGGFIVNDADEEEEGSPITVLSKNSYIFSRD